MIKLRFTREADLFSDIIAWFTQGKYSHVDCILPDGRALGARSDKVGNHAAGVWARPANYARFAVETVLELSMTTEEETRFYEFLKEQTGKPYDHIAIWGFIVGRQWREEDSWICSELIAAALEYSGRIPKLKVASSHIAPNPLFMVISAIQP